MKSTVENKKKTALTSETQYLELEGRILAYRSIGEGSPILLINRFRGTLDTWDPLFLDTLAQKHQVVYFDYTGIGYSTGTLPTDMTVIAKDAKDVAIALELKNIAVLGWSFGGLVAQVAAFSYPDLFKQAILVGTGPSGKREFPVEQAFLDAALKPTYDINDEIILFFEQKSEASKLEAVASHERIAQRLDVSKIPSQMEVLQLYFKSSAGLSEDPWNFREKLKTTTIPILIICGDHDISFAVQNWYPLIGEMSTGQLIVFPQTGHAPQHEHVELVVNYIESFLTNVKNKRAL